MARMTKTSKENLMVADRIEIDHFEKLGVYTVRVWRGDRMAYLLDSEKTVEYPTIIAARRAVRRLRPDLEPTTI